LKKEAEEKVKTEKLEKEKESKHVELVKKMD
jgi:hypothetical protein